MTILIIPSSPIIISLTIYTNSSEPMVIVEEEKDEIEHVEVEEDEKEGD